MRALFERKPWLFIVVGLGLFVLCDMVFLWICIGHPPISVKVP